MSQLFKIAFKTKKNLILIVLAVVTMCFLTFSSQLEIFTLGVMAKKGPDVFELFSQSDQISKEELTSTWSKIDQEDKGYISRDDVTRYQATLKHKDFIEQMLNYVSQKLSVQDGIYYLAIFIIVVALMKAIALFTYRFVTKVVSIKVSADLRQSYFEHIQSLPLEFYQKYNIGSLSSRVVGDAIVIAEAVNACLINYFETPFRVISCLVLCFLTSWQLSLIIFFGFPLVVLPIIFLANRVKRISRQVQKNQEQFASVLIDFLAGIQTVKIFAMEEFSLKKYREHNKRMASLEKRSARYDVSSRPILHTIAMFFLATTLLYGLYVLHMSVAEVLVYCGFLYVFYEPIKKFAEENSRIQRGVAAAERMFEVLALQPQIQDKPSAVQLSQFNQTIEFDNVWFKYDQEWILKGVSFTIKKGETVAIVGPTGAGKSTIVQLLPRLYEVQKGEIRIDGKPLDAYTQKSLRENIAFVPQKPFLFLDTVAENITFGRPYHREEVQEAARKAFADEFIQQLPKQYDTELAEGGRNLSGGQQQRLAIARALVKRSPILVMDEATSSLDAISENHIKTAIGKLHGTVTQVIIAHRLSTIENADKIIYLEGGEKIAEGTRQQLLNNCPSFKKMWEMAHERS